MTSWRLLGGLAIVLNAEPSLTQRLDSQLQSTQILGRVRAGGLPRASAAGLHLPTDEHCYFNIPATRLRYLKSGTRADQGQLVVTNRKVRFSAFERGGEIALSKVLSVVHFSVHYLSLEATSNSLSGDYTVQDAEWAATVVDTTAQDRSAGAPSRQ